MATQKRNVIVFQSSDCENEITRNLCAFQWNALIANNIDQVANIVSNYRINVGLCVIDQCNDNPFLSQINQLFNLFSRLNWIMCLPKECLDTSFPSLESKLISEYCYDYLTLPIRMERLVFSLGHADGMAEIVVTAQKNDKGITDSIPCYGIIGNSPVMINLFKSIEKFCQEDCTVHIEGETGTGKELAANDIHYHSSRSRNPLVTLNCGAFPKDLIQAELFGYEKGAFTGAQQQK